MIAGTAGLCFAASLLTKKKGTSVKEAKPAAVPVGYRRVERGAPGKTDHPTLPEPLSPEKGKAAAIEFARDQLSEKWVAVAEEIASEDFAERGPQLLADAVDSKEPGVVATYVLAGVPATREQMSVEGDYGFPLTFACQWDRSGKLARALVVAGADVNQQSSKGGFPMGPRKGETALHAAAECRPSLIRMLVDAGANPNAATPSGHTPLHRAFLSTSRQESLCEMIRCGGNPHARATEGCFGATYDVRAIKKRWFRECEELRDVCLEQGWFEEVFAESSVSSAS